MTEPLEQINPLQISFSNQKGFEVSTPSQGSPAISDKQKPACILSVKTPRQVFDPQQIKQHSRKSIALSKINFPTSTRHSNRISQSLNRQDVFIRNPYIKMFETRYQSTHKRNLTQSLMIQSVSMHQSMVYDNPMREKKRAQILKWDKIEPTNHLKEISRLNDLINKVSNHMSMFNRLYPAKRK